MDILEAIGGTSLVRTAGALYRGREWTQAIRPRILERSVTAARGRHLKDMGGRSAREDDRMAKRISKEVTPELADKAAIQSR